MTVIKTKSVYEPIEESDGRRILVMRRWPRGLRKERVLRLHGLWIPNLAPSLNLLTFYRRKLMSWEEFASAYQGEMEYATPRAYIQSIAAGAFGETVTLLCWERDTERCHRFILKDLIEKESQHLVQKNHH